MQERYRSFKVYQHRIRKALNGMVRERLFLCEDADAELTRLYAAGVAAGVPAPEGGVLPAPTPLQQCKGHDDDDDDDQGHH